MFIIVIQGRGNGQVQSQELSEPKSHRLPPDEYFKIEDSTEGMLLRGGPEELFKAAMKSAREYAKSKGR